MKRKIVCQVVLIAGITSYLLFIPNVFSSTREIAFSQIEETNEFIDMKGLWDNIGIERSLPTIPISAYLSGNFIHIQNDKPDCDITIRIICPTTGETQYQQMIPETATANILIPISNLPSGTYLLELTGPGNRHLEGNFHK